MNLRSDVTAPLDMELVRKLGYDPVSGDSCATILYHHGRALMIKGQFEDALTILREAYTHRIHFKTLYHIGECLVMLNRRHEAVEPLAAATALNRGGQAPRLLAEVLLHQGDVVSAIDAALTSLERAPGYRKALRVLANAPIQDHLRKLSNEDDGLASNAEHDPLQRLVRLGITWKDLPQQL